MSEIKPRKLKIREKNSVITATKKNQNCRLPKKWNAVNVLKKINKVKKFQEKN